MEIEWHVEKALTNFKKHKVSFDEAATALLDSMALVMEDPFSVDEQRWVLTGMSGRGRLLALVYSVPSEGRIRLISARKATSKEAFYYA